jgi:hypothetical protein
MSLNFPSSPTIGQVYPSPVVPGAPQYVWDGTVWNSGGGVGAVRYDLAQTLTAPQQAQSRTNIGAAQATVFDTVWKPFPYVNSWVDYGAPYAPAGYRILPSGLVILKGLCQNGTTNTICTLPAGYRPGITMLYTAYSNNIACRIDIAASGLISHTGGNSAWISLGGISFLAEN